MRCFLYRFRIANSAMRYNRINEERAFNSFTYKFLIKNLIYTKHTPRSTGNFFKLFEFSMPDHWFFGERFV